MLASRIPRRFVPRGVTEIIGDIVLKCTPPTGEAGGLFRNVPEKIDISVRLNAPITNDVNTAGVVMVSGDDEMPGYSDGDLVLMAVELDDAMGAPDVNSPIADSVFGDGKLSDDDLTIEWKDVVTGIDGADGLNLDGPTEFGFQLTLMGIRADAASLGNGEKITAIVSVEGAPVHNTPREAASVKSALVLMDAKGYNKGLQCNKTTEKVTIKIREGDLKKPFKAGFMEEDSFVITLSDIPEGVTVTVPSKAGEPAVAVVADADAVPPVVGVDASFGLELVEGRGDNINDDNELQLTAAGNGSVKYSIVSPTAAADAVDLVVEFEWAGGVPATGAAWVNVSFDPIGGDKLPRFAKSDNTFGVLAIAECGTSLLFPFVTNMSHYDTGVALANPSDAAGSCTVSFAGRDDYEMDLAAGATGVFGLSVEAMGYQGLMTAQCNFEGAEGFVFISSRGPMGAPAAAHGYLAEDVTE